MTTTGNDGIRVFEAQNGWSILVGKTAQDNDQLSLKIGKPYDFWFHVAGMPGSHVIARHPDLPERCDREIKQIAAGLAAFFSKARTAKRVSVHWTTCKNVSKRRGAPAGQVQLKRFDAITVEPLDPSTIFGGS